MNITAKVKTPARHRERLHGLDFLRAVAALCVLLYHYSVFTKSEPLARAFARIYESGYLGVDFFFVLSGYVLATRYYDDLRNGVVSVDLFVNRRIARLLPLNLLTLIFVAAWQSMQTHWGIPNFWYASDDLYSFVLNAVLLQCVGLGGVATFNGPSWSVSVELAVNIAFAFMLYQRRTFWSFAIAAFVCWVIILNLSGDIAVFGENYFKILNSGVLRCGMGFSAGVVLYCLTQKACFNPLVYDAIFVGAMSATLYLGSHMWLYPHSDFVMALACFPSVIAGAARGLLFPRLLGLRYLRWVGESSYSIYLLHFPVFLVFHFVSVTHTRVSLGTPVALILFLTTVLALAIFSYRFFERPCQKWVNSHFVPQALLTTA